MDLCVVFVKDRILVSWYFLSIFHVPFRARSSVLHFLLIHFGPHLLFSYFCGAMTPTRILDGMEFHIFLKASIHKWQKFYID